MRNLLTAFLEASAARGVWDAAVVAWHSAVTGGVATTGQQMLLLTRILAQAGRWQEAVRVAGCEGAAMCLQRLSASRVAMVTAADAGCWTAACLLFQYSLAAAKKKNVSSIKKDGALCLELVMLTEFFERQVIEHIPLMEQELWTKVVCDARFQYSTAKQSDGDAMGRCQHVTNSNVVITNNEDLLHIYRSPKSRFSWARALQVLLSMPHPNAASVGITVGILGRQGRKEEAVYVITEFMSLHGIYPTAVMVKTVSEAANKMRSRELCSVILATAALRDQLTPSSAVPLLVALQRMGDWRLCLEWWGSLPQAADSSDAGSGTGKFRRHLKLSSYVAVCAALGGKWTCALGVLKEASQHNPPLAVLFALRALRVAGEWRAAVTIFVDNRHVWGQSSVAPQVREVMVGQNAESWVPPDIHRSLCKLPFA